MVASPRAMDRCIARGDSVIRSIQWTRVLQYMLGVRQHCSVRAYVQYYRSLVRTDPQLLSLIVYGKRLRDSV